MEQEKQVVRQVYEEQEMREHAESGLKYQGPMSQTDLSRQNMESVLKAEQTEADETAI